MPNQGSKNPRVYSGSIKHPSIPYPGGKARMAKQIVAVFPQQGRIFVDAFAGHGNVFWAAAETLNYKEWWINDLFTAPLFEAIKSIGNTIEIPPRSKEEYYKQWDLHKHGDFGAIILQPYLTFGGGGYGSAGPGGKKSAGAAGYTKTMRRCHEILHRTDARITGLDYLKLGLENLTPDDSVYFDPPYKEADVRAYAPGDLNHIEMVDLMKRMKAKWVLSEFYDPLYIEAFGEPFFQREIQLNSTNFAKEDGDKGKARRVECMWKNF